MSTALAQHLRATRRGLAVVDVEQPDLFSPEPLAPKTGRTPAAPMPDPAAERAAWQAGFERTEWVAPYDCGLGPAGTVVLGWRCPDPECAQVEVNACLLSMNHGWDPDVPGHEPYDGHCHRLRLLAAQARAAEQGGYDLAAVRA